MGLDDQQSRKPKLAEVIKRALAGSLADLRVSVPGKVESFDPATQLASVQPLLQEVYTDEEGEEHAQTLPVVTHVPVMFPTAGGYLVSMPVAVGDRCWLLFSDRSLDLWLSAPAGSIVDPVLSNRHALSDAVCILGGGPSGDLPTIDVAAMVLGSTDPTKPRVRISESVLELDGGTLPIARKTDTVQFDSLFYTWVLTVQTALQSLGVPIVPPYPVIVPPVPYPVLGAISTGAPRVKG